MGTFGFLDLITVSGVGVLVAKKVVMRRMKAGTLPVISHNLEGAFDILVKPFSRSRGARFS